MSFDTLVSRSARQHGLDSLPEELRHELDVLEQNFTVDAARLKQISQKFEEELSDGLRREDANIPMNVTWVLGLPKGDEEGKFLTIDVGGTNLRVCWIELRGRGNTTITQESVAIPEYLKTSEAGALWNYVVDTLWNFVEKNKLRQGTEEPFSLGFTFSYPATQSAIDHGILQRWTKGFDIKGVEGQDVVSQLREVIEKKRLPIKVVALVNDTVGAMIASAYHDPETIIGAIFGTGCNAAYMEDVASIPKLQSDLPNNQMISINCEYGAFDNTLCVLPRTMYDETIDIESLRPGQQTFEKLSAGLYLGELFRLIILHMFEKGLLFQGQDVTGLRQPYAFDTSMLAQIETDLGDMKHTDQILREHLGLHGSITELSFCFRVAVMIGTRSARLCACGIAAICKKKGIKTGHVAADGGVANRHPEFKRRWATAMGEILDWPSERVEDPIVITSSEDGSGFGAAVIAAMTLRQSQKR